MTKEKFKEFWDKWVEEWLKSSYQIGGTQKHSEMCEIRADMDKVVYRNYIRLKELVKNSYFKDVNSIISRYKRAAVLTYAIILSKPLNYFVALDEGLDKNYLKQKLALFMGLASIIQDYKKDEVEGLEQPIFYFDEVGAKEREPLDDTFLVSIYKALFFAEIYKNYDVLTTANFYRLLAERTSKLSELMPIK